MGAQPRLATYGDCCREASSARSTSPPDRSAPRRPLVRCRCAGREGPAPGTMLVIAVRPFLPLGTTWSCCLRRALAHFLAPLWPR